VGSQIPHTKIFACSAKSRLLAVFVFFLGMSFTDLSRGDGSRSTALPLSQSDRFDHAPSPCTCTCTQLGSEHREHGTQTRSFGALETRRVRWRDIRGHDRCGAYARFCGDSYAWPNVQSETGLKKRNARKNRALRAQFPDPGWAQVSLAKANSGLGYVRLRFR
jgi:hypothetical protein